jgi:hypothetical protein
MSVTSISKFNYVVLRTNFTSRIVRRLLSVGTIKPIADNQVRGDLQYRINENYLNVSSVLFPKCPLSEVKVFMNNLCFIADPDQISFVPDDTITNLLGDLVSPRDMDYISTMDGIVCLACAGFSDVVGYLRVLRALNYCHDLDFDHLIGMDYVEENDLKVLVLHFNTQSE